MNTEEKLEACERKKMDGNALFREGKFNDASNKYDKERNLCFCKEEIFLLFP